MSCPDCFKGAIHDHAEPQGQIETVYGVRTYVAGGNNPSQTKTAIIFVPDAFGLKLVNNKLLADRYAAETNSRVLIPDFLYGGGLDPWILPVFEGVMAPLSSWFAFGEMFNKVWGLASVLPYALPFVIWGRPQGVYPEIVKYARSMKRDLPAGGKLGAAGFCWGGWVSTHLCEETVEEDAAESGPLLGAQFNAHPSFLKTPQEIVDAIAKYNVPYLCGVAAEDFYFHEKAALETEAILRERVGLASEKNYQLKIFKGCKHGFGVRAAPDNKVNIDGYEQAAKDAVEWFNRYLN